MSPERLAETEDGPTVNWMRRQAILHNVTLTGSLIIKDGQQYFNRLFWMHPDGTYNQYNKRHLFRMGQEDLHYAAGSEKVIVLLKGWKICPLICYDLRFPVWSRNRWTKTDSESLVADYDMLIYVANWPEIRRYAWEQLLRARAIENQCYVVGLNRVGADGKQVPHSGNSAVINFLGEVRNTLPDHQEGILTTKLNFSDLEAFRNRFPVGMDADDFQLHF
jgi:omega-amidase